MSQSAGSTGGGTGGSTGSVETAGSSGGVGSVPDRRFISISGMILDGGADFDKYVKY